MRRTLIAGNWKMHKTRDEATAFVRHLSQRIGPVPHVDVLICPPFTALSATREAVAGTAVQLGAQNVHWQEHGAYTGEISIAMLTDCGCTHVLVGHSERRQLFKESDEEINRKLKRVLGGDLTPVLCVGETLQDREGGRIEEVVLSQLGQGLSQLTAQEISRIIVAYEPVWAIGTGRTATPEIAQEVHALIRSWFHRQHSAQLADSLRVLYGGSVKPSNVNGLMSQPDIDGALVGGASLDAETFAELCAFKKPL